jgi:hypothetical protein
VSRGEEPASVGRSARRQPPLRAFDLLAVLSEHDVEFIVIGGISHAAHGYVRGTEDLDIVPDPSPDNLRRLLGALESLDAEPLAVGDFDSDELMELNLENLALGGNWLLRTRFGRLDVMQYVEGMESYQQLREQAITPDFEALPHNTLFAGRDDLIALKRAAGREQDLIDIAQLERARRNEQT